jgi:tRNA nucleotidyltransferase/poly(A) polymerase
VIEAAQEILAGEEAFVVGGAVRDELLGKPVVDVDIACRDPARAARAYGKRQGGAPFPLSERHGAWRVALEDGRTIDFTPLHGSIEEDLATRDFTINAVARPLAAAELVDPFEGRSDLEGQVIRAVSERVFGDDPLRLLRAVRLEDELGFRIESRTEGLIRDHARLVTSPAGERILGELCRLSTAGYGRLADLGLLHPLGGSLERADRADAVEAARYRLVVFLGEAVGTLPISKELRRFALALLRSSPPEDASPRAVHRFRRGTEPWALEALAFHGRNDLAAAVREARDRDPAEPLVRGDELGLPPGPEIGRLLELIEEERAVGTITTREEALDYVRRHAGSR